MCLSFFSIQAQDGADVLIYGNVKDHFSRKKLEGVTVKVTQDGKSFDSQVISGSGKYEFFLPLDHVYAISFEKSGFVTKFFELNAKGINKEDLRGGFSMPADVSLFETMENVDFSLLKAPIGKAQYEPEHGAMEWDMAYTNNMLNEIARLMREVEKAVEEEEKKEDAAALAAAKLEEDYKKFIAQGDAEMTKKSYEGAVSNFSAALGLKPGDAPAKTKLDAAQKKLDEQLALAEKEKNYNKFIDAADNAFKAKNWQEAVTNYDSALGIKSGEKYPTDQKKLANAELEKEKAAAANEAAVAKLIQEGDAEVGKEAYQKGIDKFKAAIALIPAHKEASLKLADAEKLLAAYQAEAEQRAAYQKLITEADGLFGKKDYQASIAKYEAASAVMPKEAYPKDKIKEAQDLMAKLAAEEAAAKELAEKQARFDALMKEGDGAMSSKTYDLAITKFSEAITVLPDNKQAKDKLADAEKAKADAAAAADAEERYRKALAEADRYFGKSEYEASIEKYREALTAKDEAYPKEKIAEAEKLIKEKLAAEEEAARLAAEAAALAEKKSKYDNFMKSAEQAMKSSSYDKAITDYTGALGIFPGDAPATDGKAAAEKAKADALAKMEEDARLKAEADALAAKQAEFDGFMADGRWGVKEKTFEKAISSFEKALNVMPDNADAQKELANAKKALEDQRSAMAQADREAAEAAAAAAKKAEYDGLMADAEEALKNKEFQEAISTFGNAASIFPDDTKAPERKAFAEKAYADYKAQQGEAEKQAQYAQYMSDAREDMKSKSYEEAISDYEGALSIIANDKDALAGIETARKAIIDRDAAADAEARRLAEEAERANAMASEKERLDKFNALVEKGDEAMSSKTFQPAIDSYTQALTIIPEDKQVQTKLERAKRSLEESIADAEAEAKRRAEEEARQAELDRLRDQEDADAAARRKAEEKDQAYQAAIAEADSYFNFKDYLVSKTYYQDALAIKPEEIYPQSRIERIELLLEQAEEDERLRAERLAKEREAEEALSFKRGSDLANSAEEDIDARMAEERRKALEDKWAAMERDKEAWKEKNTEISRGAGSRLDENERLTTSYAEKQKDMNSEAGKRAQDLAENMAGYKDAMGNQDKRREVIHAEKRDDANNEIKEYKDKSAEEQERYYGKSSTYADHQKEVLALNKSKEAIKSRGEDTYEYSLSSVQKEEQLYNAYLKEKEKDAIARLDEKEAELSKLKEAVSEENANASAIRKSKEMADVELAKQKHAESKERLASLSEEKRTLSQAEIERIETYTNGKDPMDFTPSPLLDEYPQGVTEETYEEGNKAVIRRIVILGNKAAEYHKVVSRSGTYYFKNGLSISKALWDLESNKVPE